MNGSVVSGVGLIAGLLDVRSRGIGGSPDAAASSNVTSSSHSAAPSDVSVCGGGVGDWLTSDVSGLVGGAVGSGDAGVSLLKGVASGDIVSSSGVGGGLVGGGGIDSASAGNVGGLANSGSALACSVGGLVGGALDF